MDSKDLDNNMESIVDEPEEKLLSPCSVDVGDIFGDPQVLPRVGHQYQADIPPLILKSGCLQLVNETTHSEILVNYPNCVSTGSIPIMWVNIEVENINGTIEFESSEESQITSKDEHAEPKVESLDAVLHNGQDVVGYSNFQSTTKSDPMDVDLILTQDSKAKLDQPERGPCPLPDSVGESWTQIECESFLLGLYIFGKNLNLVKRFVESKVMGDILSFYYGKFYRSDGYRRWSECRKLRSRRFVHGQKIFTGWRQQELFSRLFSDVPEECKNKLLEESRKFGEGKISFEEYIFTLKNAVGIGNLIDAVGVGKGKKDLTGTAMEPIKTNNMFFVQPDIPFGKACSALTSADIIRFLTGDFRLSKARSSDLFWEAVWPRLLARGWHSEQPKDHSFANSKNSLVFLIPGVKKFSRRKLVKGDHYFDSVSDVLNKVALEPGLLELEIDAANGSDVKENDRLDQLVKHDSDGLSNKQHRCYLQPRKSSYNRHVMQFTIVDTSLFYGAGQSKVRELRSLPIETTSISTPCNLSRESEEDTSEDEEEETNIPNLDDTTDRGAGADSLDCASSIPNDSISNTPTSTNVTVENHANHSTSPFDDEQQKSCIKFQFYPKGNSGNPNCFALDTKQQGFVAGINGESSCSFRNILMENKVDENEFHYRANSQNGCEDMVFQLGPPQNLSLASSLAKDSPDKSYEGNASENCLDGEISLEKPERRTLIDLNVPQVSSDFGNNEQSKDMVKNNDSFCENKLSVVFEPRQQLEESNLADDKSSTVQHPIMTNRRQSTRNRPLTTKALEAFAFGYLSPKRKRKDEETPQKKAISKPSRRMRSKTVGSGTLNNGVTDDIADSRIENSLDALRGNTNIVDEY